MLFMVGALFCHDQCNRCKGAGAVVLVLQMLNSRSNKHDWKQI